jgi:uncharacterized membrane protein
MEILIGILVILHFIGLASLLGGFLVQVKDTIAGKGKVIAAMFHGALTQLVTGLLLVGLVQMAEPGEIDNAKIAVKLVVLIVITVLVIRYRKKPVAPSWVLWAIGGLTVANIAVAVLWK